MFFRDSRNLWRNLLTVLDDVLSTGKIGMNGGGQLSLSLWYFRLRLTIGWSRTINQVRPIISVWKLKVLDPLP